MDVGICRVNMVGLTLTSPTHFCPTHWVGQKCVGEVREMGGAELCRRSERNGWGRNV